VPKSAKSAKASFAKIHQAFFPQKGLNFKYLLFDKASSRPAAGQ